MQHVIYDDSVHCELPAERVRELIERNGVVHIELAPGDCVCWHDSMWHYSPPNLSDKGRIGIAGVYTTPNQVRELPLPPLPVSLFRSLSLVDALFLPPSLPPSLPHSLTHSLYQVEATADSGRL